MEAGAFAYATQHGTQHGAEGVTRHHSIQSNQSPRAIRAMVESGVNSNVIFSFIGYGPIRSIGELTTCYRGSTTRDQPAWQVGRDECSQGIILHDDADQAFMTTCYRGSTTRDQPACQVNLDQCCQVTVLHDRAGQALMETGKASSLNASIAALMKTGEVQDNFLTSNTASWWSTPRDYPAFHEGLMKTGEVINPRCSENRGSAAQHS